MSALGSIYAAALVVAGVIVLAILIGGALVLRAAERAVRKAGPRAARPGRRERLVSDALSVAVLLVAISPLAAMLLAQTLIGPRSVPGDTGLVAVVALTLGALAIASARLLRHPEARSYAGGLLLLVLFGPAAIQVWVTSQTIAFAAQHRTAQQEAERRATRYADIIDGPSVGEIIVDVGQVGSWRAVGGELFPFLRSDEWIGDQGAVADHSGGPVRFAFLVQCWVEGDPGTIQADVYDFDRGNLWSATFGSCDGTMQVVVSESVTLVDWPDERLAAARKGDRLLVSATARPVAVGGAARPGDYAVRSVVYVSSEPATAIDALIAAVTPAAGSFSIR